MTAGLCPDPDARTLVCMACGRLCEPRANGWQHVRPRCGAWMPYARETCYRTVGHRDSHRSRYVMECDNASRRTMRMAA